MTARQSLMGRRAAAVALFLAALGLFAVTTAAVGQNVAERLAGGEPASGWQLVLAPLSLASAAYVAVWAFRLGKGIGQAPQGRDVVDALGRIETQLAILPELFAAQQARDSMLTQMMRDHERATDEARRQIALMFDRESRDGVRSRRED